MANGGATIKSLVKTLSGTDAQTLGTGMVSSSVIIQADSGDTVYIGDSSSITSSTAFQIPTTPIALGSIFDAGNNWDIDLSTVYVIGSDGDKVRLCWVSRP